MEGEGRVLVAVMVMALPVSTNAFPSPAPELPCGRDFGRVERTFANYHMYPGPSTLTSACYHYVRV